MIAYLRPLVPLHFLFTPLNQRRRLVAIEPDFIHIVADGKVVQTGDKSLSGILEEEGFTAFK